MLWKDEAEEALNRQRAAKSERERKVREERERREAAEKEAKKRRLFEQHRRRFRCCVCGKSSEYPAKKNVEISVLEGCYPVYGDVDDWTKPGDLYWCSECGKWACWDCYLSGDDLCRKCVQKKIEGKKLTRRYRR